MLRLSADRSAARPASTKRSLPNMMRGETKPLSDEFSFEGERQLSLFKNDGDWYDRNDFIGRHRKGA